MTEKKESTNPPLYHIIYTIINILENQHRHEIPTEEEKRWLATTLERDLIDKIDKFILGSKEHGGDFLTSKRNNMIDIESEITDLFFYIQKAKHLTENKK